MQRKVLHIQILEDDSHHYYGSLAKVYEDFTTNDLGISINTIYCKKEFDEKHPIITDKAIIRIGYLKAKGKTEKTVH
jgi:hypothetical protein